MRKKRGLSYEAKVILVIIAILVLIFAPINILDNVLITENSIKNFYEKYINIYPIYLQIFVILLPFIIYFIVKQIRKNRCSYKEDIIYNLKWKWDWSKDNIINLQCYCPHCGSEVYYDDTISNYDKLAISKLEFICDNCNKVVASLPNTNSTKRSAANIQNEIQRVINIRVSKM